MRRAMGWGLAPCLMLLLAATVAEGQTRESPTIPERTPWYWRLVPFRKAAKTNAVEAKSTSLKTPLTTPESPVSSYSREKADWIRRAAVCDRLREIAATTNDDELDRQAEQLNQRAWQVFLKRTSQGSAVQAGLPSAESTLTRPSRPSTQSGQSLLTPAIRVRGSADAREE